jgi:hypothetical protein
LDVSQLSSKSFRIGATDSRLSSGTFEDKEDAAMDWDGVEQSSGMDLPPAGEQIGGPDCVVDCETDSKAREGLMYAAETDSRFPS